MQDDIKKPINEVINETQKETRRREPRNGMVVDCVRLNIRIAPSIDAGIIKTIVQGTVVQVIDKESVKDFYCVKTEDGISGYCMKKFIKILK